MMTITIPIARIFVDMMMFLESTDEDILDPDAAIQMMEWLGHSFSKLDKPFLYELVEALGIIASDYDTESQKMVRHLRYDFEAELAADDPVKLAEIEARRDADEW